MADGAFYIALSISLTGAHSLGRTAVLLDRPSAISVKPSRLVCFALVNFFTAKNFFTARLDGRVGEEDWKSVVAATAWRAMIASLGHGMETLLTVVLTLTNRFKSGSLRLPPSAVHFTASSCSGTTRFSDEVMVIP